jgi:glycosyltransferase involved in cell wall biosynthesis
MTRRGHWFFAYTQSGADHVINHGFPATRVTVLGNTVDTNALAEDLKAVSASDLAEFAGQNGLTRGRTALFVGGIDAGKDIDFLLRSADDAHRIDPDFVMLIAGTGELFPWLVSRVRNSDHVRALGRLEGKRLALALASADLIVIPRGIGLVAVDALTAGLPVITRRNGTHGPEADYLSDQRSSLWLPADCSANDYAQGVVHLLHDSQRLSVMRQNCLADSSQHDLGQMVESFVSGVLAWRDIEVAGL